MSREQIVRDTAYAIWEAEGKPEGRDADHWRQAEARVAGSIAPAGAKAKPPAKGKSTEKPVDAAQAKPPAKMAATKAGPKTKNGGA
ncbi:DUF2934 domain-containing protein [Bosea sp. PAMC 26642]|uniref:DUF2934 domain-containing protein n=1 Tax=Bosea sp. (strain PAMC 26642) TaxID=1792307 RepID=UPI00076FF18E|nr:DUF2934 domain-containing protein [Bosea sp. PAMC 26642]AMJ60572.1 hypothetical protein AXW83_09955 [Bosea sp. PAMC 26642]